jgi:hypothetical protein
MAGPRANRGGEGESGEERAAGGLTARGEARAAVSERRRAGRGRRVERGGGERERRVWGGGGWRVGPVGGRRRRRRNHRACTTREGSEGAAGPRTPAQSGGAGAELGRGAAAGPPSRLGRAGDASWAAQADWAAREGRGELGHARRGPARPKGEEGEREKEKVFSFLSKSR